MLDPGNETDTIPDLAEMAIQYKNADIEGTEKQKEKNRVVADTLGVLTRFS